MTTNDRALEVMWRAANANVKDDVLAQAISEDVLDALNAAGLAVIEPEPELLGIAALTCYCPHGPHMHIEGKA